MSDFLAGSVQRDEHLTELAIDFAGSFKSPIAEFILPVHYVNKRVGDYLQYGLQNLKREDTHRAPGSGVNKGNYDATLATYGPIEDYGFAVPVTDRDIEEFGQDLAETNATQFSMQKVLLDRELRLASVMAATGSITQNTTLVGADQWSDYSGTSDPIDDIETAKAVIYAASGLAANTLVMERNVYNKLRNHPDLIGRINGLKDALSLEQLKSIFDVENIIVASGIYDTARQGATTSTTTVWGKHAWVGYINPMAASNRNYLTFGHTLSITKNGELGASGAGIEVVKWNDPDPTAKTMYVAAQTTYEQKIMSTACMYLIKNAIA